VDTGSLIATNGRTMKQPETIIVVAEEEAVVGDAVEASTIDPPAVATVIMHPMTVEEEVTLVTVFISTNGKHHLPQEDILRVGVLRPGTMPDQLTAMDPRLTLHLTVGMSHRLRLRCVMNMVQTITLSTVSTWQRFGSSLPQLLYPLLSVMTPLLTLVQLITSSSLEKSLGITFESLMRLCKPPRE